MLKTHIHALASKCLPLVEVSREKPQEVRTLSRRIVEVLASQGFRRREKQVAKLARNIRRSTKINRNWLRVLGNPAILGKADILSWISMAHKSGDRDETLWRVFLAGHFGRLSANPKKASQVQSASRLLCGLGKSPTWTWKRVSSDLRGFKGWLTENRSSLRELRFGNHRKYESKKPQALYEVIASFVSWVRKNGGTPSRAFAARSSKDPEEWFDSLYRSLEVHRFGRTARFDTLCLLADMRILPVKPGSCYIRGATGPLRGARKLWGKRSPSELNLLAEQAAKSLQVPVDVFEDALCNWQK